MASQKIDTMNYFVNRTDAAAFVEDILPYLGTFSALTMTIKPDGSGGYSARSVIDMSLASTETLNSLKQQLDIFKKRQTCLFQRENGKEVGERNEL